VVDYFNHLELGVCVRINALSRRSFVRAFFSAISRMGDYPAYVILGLVIAAKLGVSEGIPFILHTLATAGVGVAVYKLIKRYLVRERPYVMHGDILLGTAPLDRYSFPSGHTLHAVSFTIFYSSYDPSMLFVLLPFAVLVAASRVILGLHYPSDVLVGGAIGAAIASTGVALTA
jgi:undecaprenyl-diphosphatase